MTSHDWCCVAVPMFGLVKTGTVYSEDGKVQWWRNASSKIDVILYNKEQQTIKFLVSYK
jgi:hypothetical protein